MLAPATMTPDSAAYVMYTSGSTGKPKGVVVEHQALADRIGWMRNAYGLTFGERIVQFGSLTFDLSVEEIFTALSTGATIELLPDGPLSLPEVLRTPDGQDVTVLDLPTAYWHQLCEQIDEISWPARLRLVILGGEQVHAAAVARWQARFADSVRLVNTYGPTEATIIATAADLSSSSLDAIGRPAIGVPVAGTRAVVVDDQLRRVPPGVAGELLLGGAGLAREYLGNPELTRQRFIDWQGGRYFRTGDRVRRRIDGNLEFVGRVDDQLKVRGFRVEPGEVEAHLVTHPGVSAAVVAAHQGALVGYVVASAGHDELRRYLGASLPHYMVPDLWVTVAAFSTNAAGKIDRRTLAPPSGSDLREQPYVAPRTDAEELVAEVWQEVLRVERVGAFDDFFELGGHSLLAVRVGARLKASTDLDVPIRTLFTNRTVAELAAAIDALLLDELAGLSDDDVGRLLDRETR
jgi:amino acid adenylation domain-containing protein